MYDVAIVGARCAGAALALQLAQAGLSVLLVDRARFPSDTISGHYIQPAGVSALARLGLGDALAATDTPPQTVMTFDAGPFALTGTPSAAADGNVAGYGPRRVIFDALLLAAAAEAGAEVWEGVTVNGLIRDGERVCGLSGVTRDGRAVGARARLVVGADGKRSRVAQLVGARRYGERPATTCVFYAYWEGFAAPHTTLFVRDGRFAVALPTNGGLTSVAIMWPRHELPRVSADLPAAFAAAAAELPWIAERLAAARRVEPFAGSAETGGFFRQAYGAGWALVGDAGLHCDPITAQGMMNALLGAEMLAGAILDGWAPGANLAACLEAYGRTRDARFGPMFALTHDLARLRPPPPEEAARLAALRDDPEGIAGFLGVMAGTVPPGPAPADVRAA